MAGLQYVICDTETTGLSTKFNEVIEISMIDLVSRQQIFRQIRAKYPNNASFDALRVCNKTLADLNNGVEQEDAVEAIDNFMTKISGAPTSICIVGHNIGFDRKFLHALWEKVGERFVPNLWCDTQSMVKQHLKTADVSKLQITKTATGRISTKLMDCCEMLGVPRQPNAHSAVADTRATFFLFKKLMKDCGIDHLEHIKNHPHQFESDNHGIAEAEVDFNPSEDIEEVE